MNKVLRHPEKDEIVRRLTDGQSIRSIVAWLNKKYAKDKAKRITNPTLQNFRKHHLNLEGKVLKDIQDQRIVIDRAVKQQQVQAEIESNNHYRDKIHAIADTHLDVAKRILQLDSIIENRIEYWYNTIFNGDATPHNADKEIRQYMDRMMILLQQYKKFVEGMADHTVEHTINIKVFNDQIGIFRDIIRDILSDLEPEKAIKFMELVNKKISGLSYESPETRMLEADILDHF